MTGTSTLREDLLGGLTAAIIALPMAIAFGVLVFAPLGPEFSSQGALAGLYGAIFTGLFAALLGGTPVQVTGPTGPMAVVMAALVVHLQRDIDSPEQVVTLVFLCVGLAGCLQVGLGLLRLGGLIKYIPYPVVAGFMNGIAVLILLSQCPRLLGVPHLTDLRAWQPATLGVGLVTMAAMLWGPRLLPLVPGAIYGLGVGTGVYYLVKWLAPGWALGATIGLIPAGLPYPSTLGRLSSHSLWSELPELLPSAAALALLGAIDSLLTSVVADAATRTRHDSNRELFGQGVGNLLAGLFGGVGGAGATVRTLVNVNAGGKTRLSGAFHSLVLLAIVVLLGPLAGGLPLVVLAGILTITALKMVDEWSQGLLFKLIGTARQKREIAINLGVVLLVTVITVTVDLIVAVGVGILVSCLLFIEKMGDTVVNRVYYGDERFSNRMRSEEEVEILQREGPETAVLELDGPLFFGSADQLADAVRQEKAARRVILDLRRVYEIDATGARILQLMQEQLADEGRRLVLAHVLPGRPKWELLEDLGVLSQIGSEHCFPDVDRALEWAEEQVLTALDRPGDSHHECPWQENRVCRGFTPEQLEYFGLSLERLEFQAGEVILSRGGVGEALYLQTRGLTTICMPLGAGRRKRLMAYGAGAVFGEMSLLEGKPRKADMRADSVTELYRLTRPALDRIFQERPELGLKILFNLGRELSERLRLAQAEIQVLDR